MSKEVLLTKLSENYSGPYISEKGVYIPIVKVLLRTPYESKLFFLDNTPILKLDWDYDFDLTDLIKKIYNPNFDFVPFPHISIFENEITTITCLVGTNVKACFSSIPNILSDSQYWHNRVAYFKFKFIDISEPYIYDPFD